MYLLNLAAIFLLERYTYAQSVTTGLCPDGRYMAQCKVNPCLMISCHEIPDAKCVENYCGGCNAKFFIKDREVTDECSKFTRTGQCPDGSDPVQCSVQPCSVTRCPKHKDAECVDDYCGGCSARFYYHGMEVTQDCSRCDSPPVNQCSVPDRVKCTIRPCDTRWASCVNFPEATCFDDYCRGCHARWFLPDCKEVTSECQKKDGL